MSLAAVALGLCQVKFRKDQGGSVKLLGKYCGGKVIISE